MLQSPFSLSSPIPTIMTPPSSSVPNSKPKHHRQNPNPSSLSSSSCCNHSSPAATLDLLILIVVLFSCTFLVASSLSHLLRSLSQALTLTLPRSPVPYLLSLVLLLLSFLLLLAKTSRICSRKCANARCKGLKKALEFDVQIQTEECIRERNKEWKEIEDLPWKGGQQGRNPDYEVLRNELRKMAPLNGRAVLLFRARCGCSVARLEAWGPKKGPRRHKRSMVNLALEGPKGG